MSTYFYFLNLQARLARTSPRGFTVFEMLLVLAIASVIGSLTLTNGISYYDRSLAGIDRSQLLAAFREARAEAQEESTSATTSYPYGVYVSNTGYVIFEGSSYASRITSEDLAFSFFTPETVSGSSSVVVFSPLSANANTAPNQDLNFSITGLDGRTESIEIGQKGSILSSII